MAAGTQLVRAWDVVALGPFLIWASRQKRLPRWARRYLFVAGLGTVLYNGVRLLQELPRPAAPAPSPRT